MNAERHFSSSYPEARGRFLRAAARASAEVSSYPVGGDAAGELAIDVAVLGRDQHRRTVVISSGLHGVEGSFGSAVQRAWLEHLHRRGPLQPARYVLLHALNPFGFAHLRRVNEGNVDLNRNFHGHPDAYRGAPAAYAKLHPLLSPASPPSRRDGFLLKAIWKRWRVGLPALQQAIAGGQYEYPRGLFFGGRVPAASTRIVQQHLASWVGESPHVIHVDLHTGLGRYGDYRLLVSDQSGAAVRWYEQAFGPPAVEVVQDARGTAYQTSGALGAWAQHQFGECRYRFVTAEFGTYSPIRVLAALRAENQAHFYGRPGSRAVRRAKADLLECFCPGEVRWRRRVLKSALRVVDQAAAAEIPREVESSAGM